MHPENRRSYLYRLQAYNANLPDRYFPGIYVYVRNACLHVLTVLGTLITAPAPAPARRPHLV